MSTETFAIDISLYVLSLKRFEHDRITIIIWENYILSEHLL